MALQKNKVKFGLNKVHFAKITAWSDEGVPTFANPVRLPGAVSLSVDANGEQLDSKGVLVERNDAEFAQFALLFEFTGDKNKIRHVLYCCSASRPANEGETTEESKSVKTEKLKLKAAALPSGLVKSKTCESTDEATYNNWYNSVYIPAAATTNNSTGTRSASTTKGGTAASTTTD